MSDPLKPRPRFIALIGPTASGKTELSVPLALDLDGEIISMDSRQVYRGMDIGTDKVEPAHRKAVPHHGLDLVDPSERYSAGRFGRDARRWIEAIEGRGRIPILVGGTGFFLETLLKPIFQEPDIDPGARRRLRAYLSALPPERLGEWVLRLDPERAEVAAAGGPQRLARTIEVALLSGRPLSWWHRNAPPDALPLEGLIVRLRIDRKEMDRRIDARVEQMMERGFKEEVQSLLDAGFGPDDPGMTGTGYREVVAVLQGGLSRREAVESTQKATRAYARRQLTWFRHRLPADTLVLDARSPVEDRIARIRERWLRVRSPSDVGGTGTDGSKTEPGRDEA